MLRTLLRWEPSLPEGRLWCAPILPPSIGQLEVNGIIVGGRNVRIEAARQSGVLGVAPEIEVIGTPHPVE
jgi:hypothetical protein